ncbi:MAG TPA: hypothetical protein VGK32_12255 [Vicinamibacterales bacterium]
MAVFTVLALALAGSLCAQEASSLSPPPPPATGAGQDIPAAQTDGNGLRLSFGASGTFASAFVWRGFLLGSDPAFQPSVWAKVGPLTITSWSNSHVRSASGVIYTEHDLIIDYSREVRGVTLSVGWINYMFPRQASGRYSNEFYVAAAAGGYFAPKAQVYHDVNEGSGTYATIGISHEYGLGSTKVSLTPGVSVGYNHHQWTERTGFSDITTGLALVVPTPIPHCALQAFLNYSHGLDTAVFQRQVYGGVTLSVQ